MIINDLDDYYIVFDTKNRNIELDTLFVECNSTLPPQRYYNLDSQCFMCGGISGGIRVELHEVPPIIPP